MTHVVVVAVAVVLSLFVSNVAPANEIGFIEEFALASDRTEALEKLIPGTEDYYYYNCLYHQQLGQYSHVDELLEAWIERHKTTPRVREILNRQALLTYDTRPEQTLEYLQQQLRLRFDHQRETLDQKLNLPTELDPRRIHRDTLSDAAFRQHQNLQGFEDSALDWLVGADLSATRRRHLLQRLQRPDYPDLARLVVADLNAPNSRGFGSFDIHRQLLRSQLDECLRLRPRLLNQANFVNTYISKLHPNPDIDWRHDASAQRDYLNRLWSFVRRLSPVHNSLKAHVLHNRLEFDRREGVYDRDRFVEYIQIPRNAGYMNDEYVRREGNRRYAANLNRDYQTVTLFPPIGNDESLIRGYLHHFFLTDGSYREFTPFLDNTYLKHNFAETKIVNAIGDPEQWYSMLPPTLYQRLKERIDLDFAPTNQRVFSSNEPVSLDLYIKNVKTLLVKVYQINTANYYREKLQEVNTDINLDGLVANRENTYEYSVPPLRRVRRQFDFPELDNPGVYVVDFIGNGKSSRVVVRKGTFRYLVRNGMAGHAFTVLDEKNNQVKDASLWMNGKQFSPTDNGTIVVPYSNQPSNQKFIISRGEFSSLHTFRHEAENYLLAAGIHVDRESLLKRQTAQVVVRPGLFLNGTPVSLSVLEDVKLRITSTDNDGIATTKEMNDFKLFEDKESVHEFHVPRRLASIAFSLSAKVKNLSQNKKIDLLASESFTVNKIDHTEKIEDLHFLRINGHYFLDLLGKNGEPRPERPVQLTIKHRDFRDPVELTLKTNQRGRIALGRLTDIDSITATDPEATSHTWRLARGRHSYYHWVHGLADQVIEIPYLGTRTEPSRGELSLLEVNRANFTTDYFNAISIADGMIRLSGLPRGDYDLWLKKADRRIRIRITEGKESGGYALGESRQLEIRNDQPLQISSLAANDESVTVQLRNWTKFSRLHVFATRYRPAFSAYRQFSRVRDAEPYSVFVPTLDSLFAQGRNIGDEYRYILDRRYAKKFPGNMLDRPSLLLNPWAVRDTESKRQEAAAGSDFDAAAEQPSESAERAATKSEEESGNVDFANLDFLADASAVLTNLTPSENGVVTIPLNHLGDHQHIHVVAIDPRSTTFRSMSLRERKSEKRDLRLLVGLSPDGHFTRQKRVSVIRGGETFELSDITTSKFEAFDSIAKVYALYATLSGNENLAQFEFITRWPDLDPSEKRKKYSQYACHELNYFLYKKDPKFFDSVVLPFIQQKMNKTFLDHWLVGNDVGEYLDSWRYSRMNVVERILLSQRLSGERPHTRRHISDLFDLLSPDIDRFNYLFNTAVNQSVLESGGTNAEYYRAQLGVELRTLQRARGMGGMAAGRQAGQERALKNGVADARRGSSPAAAKVPDDRPALADSLSASVEEMDKEAAHSLQREAEKLAERAESARRRSRSAERFGQTFSLFAKDLQLRKQVQQLYRKLDKTKEWAENNYYHLPIDDQNANLITVNAFWHDFAEHDPTRPFLSPNLAEATRSFPEMMFALSVLDLPFEPGEQEREFDEARMEISAESPMVVFHEEIRPAETAAEATPLLVSQDYFRLSDRYQYKNNQRLDKFVTDEFLVQVVYGCQIVVTNPTSSQQQLDILTQLPIGAIPVKNGQFTRGIHIDLEPFNTKTIEYFFYFPKAGDFGCYPVHVSKNAQLLAHAEPFRFKVVDEPTAIDTQSWDYISQFGTAQQVFDFLNQHNPRRIELSKIAFRLRDRDFYHEVIRLLKRRHIYEHMLWSYGVKHNDVATIREFLSHADQFVSQCGAHLESELLTINPVLRKTYQHMEYNPLVNARAHQLGARRQILNDRIHAQYHRLMKNISYRHQMSDQQLMEVTYYLLLQDRIAEAESFFQKVNPTKLATRLQYDYFTAYLSFFGSDQQLARDISEKYADHPVNRWSNAFANIRQQLDEISGGDFTLVDSEDRTQTQTERAASHPSFDFKVESKKVAIDYQNLRQVEVRYYLMDIELLFSHNPFVQEYSGQFSFIRPNGKETITLPENANSMEFDLPQRLHSSNVLVEISGAGEKKTQAYYANSLAVQIVQSYGQLQVLHATTRSPLSTVYVKVYAETRDGNVQFFKDGYTDLRGRFDYTSLNTNELDHVKRFSILVLSEQHGAVVREASPPMR